MNPIRKKRLAPARAVCSSRRCLLLPLGSVTLTLITASSVLADVKIVTELSIALGSAAPATSASSSDDNTSSGTQPVAPGRAITLYYKGSMARRETPGGLVMLYDGAANKAYALNPQQKTYAVVALKDAYKWLNAVDATDQTPFLLSSPAALPEGARRDTKVEVEKTGLQHTVVDVDTQKYTLYATESIQMEAPQRSGGFGGGGMGGGGRRGGRGGRFPGGGGSYPSGGSPDGSGGARRGGGMPSTEMQGDLWLADASVLPDGVKSPLLPLLQGTIPDTTILKSVCDKVSKLKCVPLSATITTRAGAGGGIYGNAPGVGRRLTAFTMQVKSITQAPLEDALFQVPSDYQKAKIDAVLRRDTATAPTASP